MRNIFQISGSEKWVRKLEIGECVEVGDLIVLPSTLSIFDQANPYYGCILRHTQHKNLWICRPTEAPKPLDEHALDEHARMQAFFFGKH